MGLILRLLRRNIPEKDETQSLPSQWYNLEIGKMEKDVLKT